MPEVKVGQKWMDRRGQVGTIVKGQLSDQIMVGFPDSPFIVIDPEQFARHHTLVEDVGGAAPPPPAPPDFKVGDVVRLKCGGPPMVVADTAARYNATLTDEESKEDPNAMIGWGYRRTPMKADEVRVSWHDADGKLTGACLSSALLVPSAAAVDLQPGEPVDWPLPTGLAGRPAP
jgi:hypothetical protein